MGSRQRQRGESLAEIFIEVAAKVSRVVGVDRGHNAGIEQALQVVMRQGINHPQLEVGQRADRERDAVLHQPLHQGSVFDGSYAMVDALDLEHIERAPDVGRRPLLAGVCHQPKTQFPRPGKHPCKLLRRVADLAGRQANAQNLVAQGQRLLQALKGLGLAQMPQKAQDQRGRHAKAGWRVRAGAVQPVDHHLGTQAVAGVGLGVKEDLGVQHLVGLRAGHVGAGHVVKILLGLEHQGACVVDVKKALQVVKHIGLAQRLHRGVRQHHAVARGHGKHQFRLQRALDVHMQLGLGHALQQVGHTLRRNVMNKRWQGVHQQTPKVIPSWLRWRR